jgi:hypothetical protein
MRIGVEARRTEGSGIGRVTTVIIEWIRQEFPHVEVLAFGPPSVLDSLRR